MADDNVFAAPASDDYREEPMPGGDGAQLAAVMEPLYRGRGWIKFVAIMMIIGGALNVLSIWGIVIAWIPIWIGVLMLQGAGKLEEGRRRRDGAQDYREANERLRKAIKIFGISVIVYLAVMVVMMLIFFVMLGAEFA